MRFLTPLLFMFSIAATQAVSGDNGNSSNDVDAANNEILNAAYTQSVETDNFAHIDTMYVEGVFGKSADSGVSLAVNAETNRGHYVHDSHVIRMFSVSSDPAVRSFSFDNAPIIVDFRAEQIMIDFGSVSSRWAPFAEQHQDLIEEARQAGCMLEEHGNKFDYCS